MTMAASVGQYPRLTKVNLNKPDPRINKTSNGKWLPEPGFKMMTKIPQLDHLLKPLN